MVIEEPELQYIPVDTIILLTGKEEFLYLGNQLHTFSNNYILFFELTLNITLSYTVVISGWLNSEVDK